MGTPLKNQYSSRSSLDWGLIMRTQRQNNNVPANVSLQDVFRKREYLLGVYDTKHATRTATYDDFASVVQLLKAETEYMRWLLLQQGVVV